MDDLQTAFYIISIVFMSIMFLLILGLLITALVIKKKVDHMHRMIDDKINAVHEVTDKVALAWRTVRKFVKS